MSSFGRDNPPKTSTSTQSSDTPRTAPGKTTRTGRISGGGRSSAEPGASVQLQPAPLAAPRSASAVDAQSEAFALGTFEHVQRKGSGNDTADVHALAAQGVQGGGGGMPHGDRIQQAFGQHDVSSVQAHTGSDAASAMGAEAYATGNHVAFRDASPSLHTAAHEAAHVVQQRTGVALQGGVGKAGDSYEQHADAVADRVVRGESAESLLDSMAGGSGAAGAVQAKTEKNDQVTIQSGQLTSQGEGNDAQTRYIHWPNTDASGVTLGKGYDIGSRSGEQVIRELTAAGMPVDQATKISKGARLTGANAGKFVRDNKESVGVISKEVQTALLSTMLVEYTERARTTATDTKADSKNRNAAGQEKAQGKEAGTFVMSQAEWSSLHPAMVEFLTDLIYQGGYYGWDRVAKINEALKANQGNHLEQFKAVRALFTSGYMDAYAGKIGEGRGGKGAKETWYGQETSYAGKFRRNSLRVAYLNHVISSLEAGKTVVVQSGDQGAGAGQSPGGEVAKTKPLEGSGGQGAGAAPQPQQQSSRGTQYVVKSGESLIKLSQKFGVSVEALKAANQSKLKRWGSVEGFNAGETITIPAQGAAESKPKNFSHVVKRGESLIKLSEKFGVSVDALKAANQSKLKRWGSVEGFNAGETITIPAGGSQQGGQQGSQQGGQQGSQQGSQQGGQQQGGQQQGGSGGKPRWISVAEAEIGQREIAGARHNPRIIEYHRVTGGFSDDETPWCASFANWVLRQAGQSGTGSARALSFLSYGTRLERPAYGAIAVFNWGGGKGHVGFVVGKQGGSVLVLGGNQGNQVKVSSFGASQVAAYVVPPGYQVPASAYSLSGAQGDVSAGGGVSDTR